MADPYHPIGTNYRPTIETYTTNRGLTLTAEEVEALKLIKHTLPASVLEKLSKL